MGNRFFNFHNFPFSLAATLVKKSIKMLIAFVVIVSPISKLFIGTSLLFFTFIISLIVFHTVFKFFIFLKMGFVIFIPCDS